MENNRNQVFLDIPSLLQHSHSSDKSKEKSKKKNELIFASFFVSSKNCIREEKTKGGLKHVEHGALRRHHFS